MPITKDNVTIEDWNRASRLMCPSLRYTCGTWIALNENPCIKRNHSECKPCAGHNIDKIVIINSRNTEDGKKQ